MYIFLGLNSRQVIKRFHSNNLEELKQDFYEKNFDEDTGIKYEDKYLLEVLDETHISLKDEDLILYY